MTRHNLLILDDFGLHPFQEADQLILYDLIEDMTHKHALILTSQIPVQHWHQLITQSTLADAVMDRIIQCTPNRTKRRFHAKIPSQKTNFLPLKSTMLNTISTVHFDRILLFTLPDLCTKPTQGGTAAMITFSETQKILKNISSN
ncbi:MAG: ATP-binding protein [Haliscomenobacter sp.]|nr:ATP-binding protein [Haliscomenobacter sp.]